ncbi:ATP-dependent RNA helicase RhlE [Sphingobium fontiphilum]|uniref:DEAD-box ATP-dependent RNA helicase RhpA n=1 Tax=Sphingobium fontiphilum TaxID=944425 RepID=A0A7W6GMP6_9SPHN|nr:DEAD/DEAH box helicase [Sphingobium fontiphilum]MBB3980702.1 ATP-dependent RNA helicase RhlE [Sphingobium fontiphilum]
MQFSDLGLAEPILKALAAKNYVDPTPIQQQAIPVLLQGKDLCGIAQTGTGKTAAFALPSLDHFARNPMATPVKGCRMLVLSPTRELAAQIAQSFRDYGRFLKLSVEVVFGGVPINKQIRALSAGVDIVVATPGRLLDLIDQRAFTIKDTEIFVLDEADQMMDMGFIHPLKRIAKLLPRDRQNLFFSATMPKEIESLAGQFLHDPVKVSVAPQSTTAERVRQQATFVNQAEKQALLHIVLNNEDIDRALIFTRTKHGADRVVRSLEGAGIQAFAIHGNKSQGQRTTALQAFRQGKVKLLVATDIAARGIDVSGVSHVINFEIPNVPEQYVHRIGRTARAGAEGVAISFVADDERPYLKAIERTTRVKLDIAPLPENFMEAVRNLPKPAAPRKGPEQSPAQKARRVEGQRRYQEGQRGNAERAHRPDGEDGAKRPFRRRRSGVGAHKGAVQRTGAPR